MAKRTLNQDTHRSAHDRATRGGTQSATQDAEEKISKGGGLDPLVDPKGPAHLGPIRRSLPRFEKQGNFWLLANGIPMAEETLLDTTGSMRDNVDIALRVLPDSYEFLTAGKNPIFHRYDPQICTATFGDIEDRVRNGKAVLCRTQFEMAEQITVQMALCPPTKGGVGQS